MPANDVRPSIIFHGHSHDMTCCNEVIHASEVTTGCECESAGFCNRHSCQKPTYLHMLCMTNLEYFDQYERGVGPLQNIGPQPLILGLGDVAAFLIRAATFGGLAMCESCQGRKSRWNRVRLWPIRWPWRSDARK